jgi:DNA-binding NarL/FixJ family response regulator
MTTEETERPFALVVADFMFAARIGSALTQEGRSFRVAGSLDQATDALRSEKPRLVLLELGANGFDRAERIRQWKSDPNVESRILAFGSHQSRELLQAARDAGADLAVSNGVLVSRFEAVLARAVKTDLPDEERLMTEEEE